MFVFITSVRHPVNSSYYERVWDLLRNTLFSVCRQTCKSFKVIVVCNKILDDFASVPGVADNVEFVEVDFDPPTSKTGPKTGVPACNKDRGHKYVIGLLAAKKYSPEYVMFFDADDFVSKSLVASALDEPGQTGWYFERGFFLQDDMISYRNKFNQMCGTSHILNYDMLTQDICFDDLSINSSQIDISEKVHPFFIKGVLGCHVNYNSYFFNIHGPLKKWDDPRSAAYNMGTGENHSGKTSNCGTGWFPLRNRNSGSLEMAVDILGLPLLNHKTKRMGITIDDVNCREAMRELELYNSAELKLKDYIRIYGDEIVRTYGIVAFLRNPWERLVNLYHLHENKMRYDTFSGFVLSGETRNQFDAISKGGAFYADDIRRSEDVSNIKYYVGHYSEYYDEGLEDYVGQMFAPDVSLGKYEFERMGPKARSFAPRTALSAIILPRLEVFFLEEWIDHHLALGFDLVRLYDNGVVSVDNSIWAEGARELAPSEVNKKWKKKPDADYFEELSDQEIAEFLDSIVDKYAGKVEVIPWVYGIDHKIEYPQSQWDSIRHSVANGSSGWWLFMDPDEYLVLRLHDTVQEFIADYPKVSCFKFKQRIFDERRRDKPVREIFNWAYDSAMPKNLIVSEIDLTETVDVHSQTPKFGETWVVPRDVAAYHHYRGDPRKLGGDKIKDIFESKGSPAFNKRDDSMKRYLI